MPIVGDRFGGEFEEFASGTRLKLDDNESYGLISGWQQDGGEFEVQYSLQPTWLSASSTVSAPSSTPTVALSVIQPTVARSSLTTA